MVRRGVDVQRVASGDVIDLGQTKIQVLWPPKRNIESSLARPPTFSSSTAVASAPAAAPLDANDSSLVLRIDVGTRSVLIPGDVGEAAETQLARLRPEELRSSVLVLPHHGSLTSTLRQFVSSVGPELVIQSNSFRQSPQELLQAIHPHPRYATFTHGWIGLSLDTSLSVKTMRP